MPLLNYPNVCTRETAHNSCFCNKHKEELEKKSIPTTLKGFMKYCGLDIKGTLTISGAGINWESFRKGNNKFFSLYYAYPYKQIAQLFQQ